MIIHIDIETPLLHSETMFFRVAYLIHSIIILKNICFTLNLFPFKNN